MDVEAGRDPTIQGTIQDGETACEKPTCTHEDPSTSPRSPSTFSSLLRKALALGRVEERGVEPLSLDHRTSTRYINCFTIWCSMNANILPITFGLMGPKYYGLGFRDSVLIIVFLILLTTLAPAFLSTLGPKTGMRQMIQARFSFGRYIVSIPVVLNLATLTGFCIIIFVVGGQCLSAVSDGALSPTLGIVLIAVFALSISFCGFKILHFYESYAFIPAVIAIVIATGTGGAHLHDRPQVPPPSAPQVLNYAMVMASYMIPWACIASDLTTYFDPRPRYASLRVFTFSYLGLILPTILLMTLGAAIGSAIPNVPAWNQGYDDTLVGGVLAAMLAPAGGFGKFVVVLLAFTLLGNVAGTMYAISLNFQTMVPWLVRVPRCVFAVVITGITIPIAIRAADDFFLNLENFVALISYWSAEFVAIVLVEHLVFRRGDAKAYAHDAWNDARRLPTGLAALGAAVLSFGLIVPCMSQAWFVGPIAKTTGDIGFEVAFILSALLYLPLRWVEKRVLNR
ncbi:purine-cytosine permease FCY21 [Sodiomyces alkalinus F11]|uniref:Purine-cytosine permease FCY21 n=1 Tax=Sodiomyces alkalinus (strain CBS 110278 / VKM F-3762 / F11) TaxID=1314773 RepID=A0A3N2PTD1_SODAK|nr:purine-cytosine permease FCY21 [Sodiomyces alkalinus F11]ROT37773.1 purine-cytosine permease FCY21 [Sodiomyces alkalinus F11]